MHFLAPVVWVLAILVWALATKNAKRKRNLLIAGVALFTIFSNDALVCKMYQLWEYPVYPINTIKKEYDVAVVLGGFTDLAKQPRDRVYLNQGADRLMHALLLYNQGKVKKIIVSGGSGIRNFNGAKEADGMMKILLMCKVDTNDILLEPEARNTHENAVYSAEIIRKNYPRPNILVFTSAFHCRRAYGCFQKQGLKVDMFPVDFRFTNSDFNVEKVFIPSSNAWEKWGILIHEFVGFFIYKIVGYI